MPWTVGVRFLAQVKPGSQWLVERAIRMSLVSEFWNEYRSTSSLDGKYSLNDANAKGSVGADQASPKTTMFASTSASDAAKAADQDHKFRSLTTEQLREVRLRHAPEGVLSPDDVVPPEKVESQTERGLLTTNDPAIPDHDKKKTSKEEEKPKEERKLKGWEKLLTIGGRVRVSTTMLLVAALVLLVLKGLTFTPANGAEGNAGILAPKATQSVNAPGNGYGVSQSTNTNAPTTGTNSESTNPSDEQSQSTDSSGHPRGSEVAPTQGSSSRGAGGANSIMITAARSRQVARMVPLVVLRGARVAAPAVTLAAVLPGVLRVAHPVAPIVVALAAVPQAGHPVVPVVIPVAPLAALVVRPAAVRVVPAAAPQAAPTPNNPRR